MDFIPDESAINTDAIEVRASCRAARLLRAGPLLAPARRSSPGPAAGGMPACSASSPCGHRQVPESRAESVQNVPYAHLGTCLHALLAGQAPFHYAARFWCRAARSKPQRLRMQGEVFARGGAHSPPSPPLPRRSTRTPWRCCAP